MICLALPAAGNRNDGAQLQLPVEAIAPIDRKRGRPRWKPRMVQGDRGYDHDEYRRPLQAAGVATEIARLVSFMLGGSTTYAEFSSEVSRGFTLPPTAQVLFRCGDIFSLFATTLTDAFGTHPGAHDAWRSGSTLKTFLARTPSCF
jgi:hypothetical protein